MMRVTRYTCLLLALLCLFTGSTGCRNEASDSVNASETTEPNETTEATRYDPVILPPNGVKILSGQESITPLCCFSGSEHYDPATGTWDAGCGGGAYMALRKDRSHIPYLKLTGPIAIQAPENCLWSDGITVYDPQLRRVELSAKTPEALSELPPGDWYISITICWQENYIASEDQYENTVNDYLFLLIVE